MRGNLEFKSANMASFSGEFLQNENPCLSATFTFADFRQRRKTRRKPRKTRKSSFAVIR